MSTPVTEATDQKERTTVRIIMVLASIGWGISLIFPWLPATFMWPMMFGSGVPTLWWLMPVLIYMYPVFLLTVLIRGWKQPTYRRGLWAALGPALYAVVFYLTMQAIAGW